MASRGRLKGGQWEFVVKRAGVLDKPLYLRFPTEEEGEAYCKRLEALLDRGIVPAAHQIESRVLTLGQLIRQYLRDGHPSGKDQTVLATLIGDVGDVPVTHVEAAWVDEWITTMKRERGLAPNTIHSKVGALARCCDWGMRKKLVTLPDHPLRTLPAGYATYTEADSAFMEAVEDEERERRLEPGEEDTIRAAIASWVPRKPEAWSAVPDRQELRNLFDLSLETAMRLREIYTITTPQINLNHRTVHLTKTKNGDSRTVPLTSVAVGVIERQMKGKQDLIFPWLTLHRGNLKLTSNYLSKVFAAIFEQAGCPDLHYHDLRREAVSRLFERTQLTTEEIMQISGHKTHKMMMRYLKLRPNTLVSKLW